jgi:hypothetical protein
MKSWDGGNQRVEDTWVHIVALYRCGVGKEDGQEGKFTLKHDFEEF